MKKIMVLCCLLFSLTSLSYSQTTQMAITGIQTGLSHEGAGGTFLGIHGMYNANLIRDIPKSSLGIVGMANYYSGKTKHQRLAKLRQVFLLKFHSVKSTPSEGVCDYTPIIKCPAGSCRHIVEILLP